MSSVHNLNTYFKSVVFSVWSLDLQRQHLLWELVRNAYPLASAQTYSDTGGVELGDLCFNQAAGNPGPYSYLKMTA